MRGRVADVIICFQFYRNRLKGFRAIRDQKWGSSIDFNSLPYNRSALSCCLWGAEVIFHLTSFCAVWQAQFTKLVIYQLVIAH